MPGDTLPDPLDFGDPPNEFIRGVVLAVEIDRSVVLCSRVPPVLKASISDFLIFGYVNNRRSVQLAARPWSNELAELTQVRSDGGKHAGKGERSTRTMVLAVLILSLGISAATSQTPANRINKNPSVGG
jgi:hypothetical protein